MVKLVYAAMMSLDGFIEDEGGNFDWAEPDREVHTFINDLELRHGTYLYGRSMYEVMAAWENDELLRGMPGYMQDFARMWRAADKVVYSASLEGVSTARTRLEPSFSAEPVRAMKASAERDLTIAGPNLAAQAFEAGLVDECQVFVAPIAVGGGKSAMPRGLAVRLELAEERRFDNGFV
jgi:dihydrofolate reductase